MSVTKCDRVAPIMAKHLQRRKVTGGKVHEESPMDCFLFRCGIEIYYKPRADEPRPTREAVTCKRCIAARGH